MESDWIAEKERENEERWVAFLQFGEALLGRKVEVMEQGKLHHLINLRRIPRWHPRGCITPSRMRGQHGVYAYCKEGKILCAFCDKSVFPKKENVA